MDTLLGKKRGKALVWLGAELISDPENCKQKPKKTEKLVQSIVWQHHDSQSLKSYYCFKSRNTFKHSKKKKPIKNPCWCFRKIVYSL